MEIIPDRVHQIYYNTPLLVEKGKLNQANIPRGPCIPRYSFWPPFRGKTKRGDRKFAPNTNESPPAGLSRAQDTRWGASSIKGRQVEDSNLRENATRFWQGFLLHRVSDAVGRRWTIHSETDLPASPSSPPALCGSRATGPVIGSGLPPERRCVARSTSLLTGDNSLLNSVNS